MTLQAEKEHTCSGIFAVMLSQKLEYVLIFNSFTNIIAHFVKEKKKTSKLFVENAMEINNFEMLPAANKFLRTGPILVSSQRDIILPSLFGGSIYFPGKKKKGKSTKISARRKCNSD